MNSASKAKAKYNSKNYDRVTVSFPKGYKDYLLACAATGDTSVNAVIVKAVDLYLKAILENEKK